MKRRVRLVLGWVVGIAAVTMNIPAVRAAEAPRVGFCEEFEKLDGWSFNPKAPCKWTGDGQTATLKDLPGGEVTWGASAAKALGKVNLDKFPYLVVYVTAVSKGFNAKLVKDGDKQVVVSGVREPGAVAVHVPKATGWSAEGNLTVILYADGDGSKVTFDKLLFVSELKGEEKVIEEKAAARTAVRSNTRPV